MGKKAEKKIKKKEKKLPLSEPITPPLFEEEALPHLMTPFFVLPFFFHSFHIPSCLPSIPLPSNPHPFFLFLSCCSCFSNLFLKVHVKIPALIPEKQLCFPRRCIAQLVVWLRATTS